MYIIYKSSDYIRIHIHILSYIPFFQNLVLTFLITTYLLDEHKKKETTHYEWFLFCVELEGIELKPINTYISMIYATNFLILQ